MIAMVSEMEDATPFGLGCTLAEGREQIQNVYTVRKRSVGLLGNVQGEKRPIAFVEDTTVPPEHWQPQVEAQENAGKLLALVSHLQINNMLKRATK